MVRNYKPLHLGRLTLHENPHNLSRPECLLHRALNREQRTMNTIPEKICVYSALAHLLFILLPTPALAQVEFGKWLGPSIGGQKARVSYKRELYDKTTVSGSEVDLDLAQHDLSLSIPIAQDSEREWSLSAAQGIHDVDTRACLPSAGECFPDTLQKSSFGLTNRRLLKGGRIVGGHLSVGSASDRPFEGMDETTVQATGFLRMPHKETNAWFFFISYSNNREFLNHVPLPGCAYWYAPSRRFFVILGVPFVTLTMRPTDDTSLSISYLAIHTVRGSAKYQILKKLGLFAKFAWTNQSYYRADRLHHDDRLFYYEKRISTGVTIKLPREFMVEMTGGYSFDRFYFEAEDYNERNRNRLDVEDGSFFSLNLHVHF